MTKGLEPEQGGRVHPAGHEQEICFHLGRPGIFTRGEVNNGSVGQNHRRQRLQVSLHQAQSSESDWREPAQGSSPEEKSTMAQLAKTIVDNAFKSLSTKPRVQNLTGGSPPREITSKLTA